MQLACAAATAMRLVTVSELVSMITASLAPPTDATTRVPSGVMAIPAGFAPTSIDVASVSSAVTITFTEPKSVLET